jgi:hypothetical protein
MLACLQLPLVYLVSTPRFRLNARLADSPRRPAAADCDSQRNGQRPVADSESGPQRLAAQVPLSRFGPPCVLYPRVLPCPRAPDAPPTPLHRGRFAGLPTAAPRATLVEWRAVAMATSAPAPLGPPASQVARSPVPHGPARDSNHRPDFR